MAGEVGLSGEIRPVNRIEQRILEAEKLGFSRIIIPHNNLKGFDTAKSKIQIVQDKESGGSLSATIRLIYNKQ